MIRATSSGARDAPEVSISRRADDIMLETRQRLKFLEIIIKNLQEPVVTFNKGDFGLDRVYSVRPQPIGECFSVSWDGDCENPALIFDVLNPERPIRVFLEVWGR